MVGLMVVLALMFLAFVVLEKFPKHHPAIVAFGTLLCLSLLGYVPAKETFSGFSNRAVITVMLTLFCGQALEDAGVIDAIGLFLKKFAKSKPKTILFAIYLSCTLCSMFMNNITAMYIFLPIGKRFCRDLKLSTSIFVMPLAFCALIGGMLSKMGTPPNMVISMKRLEVINVDGGLFYDTPLAILVCTASLIAIQLLATKLLPNKSIMYNGDFERDKYLFVLKIRDDLKKSFEDIFPKGGAYRPTGLMVIVAKNGLREVAGAEDIILHRNDIIVVKCADKDIAAQLITLLIATPLELQYLEEHDLLHYITIDEDSRLIGRSPGEESFSSTDNVRLLAWADSTGVHYINVGSHQFMENTSYLVLGATKSITKFIKREGLPSEIPEGDYQIKNWKIMLSASSFLTAILASNLGLISLEIALSLSLFVNYASGILKPKAKTTVGILLMAALVALMIPIGDTIESSGAAKVLAQVALSVTSHLPMPAEYAALLGIILASIFIANFIDNTAAAQMMLPIAISAATILNVSPDPFFAGIMIGVSTTMMLPIAHNCTILAQRECGYSTWDFIKFGGILTAIIVFTTMIAIPVLYRF